MSTVSQVRSWNVFSHDSYLFITVYEIFSDDAQSSAVLAKN